MKKTNQNPKIQEGEEMIFGNEPAETRCPYCGTNTITEVIFTNGIMTYILAFILLLSFGVFFSMILIPLAFIFTKSLAHKCGACEQEIGTNGEVIFGSGIKDGILSMKIGELGCILTKRIFITTVLSIIAVLVLWYRVTHFVIPKNYGHSHLHDQLTFTNTTWVEFKDDCGLEKIQTHEKYHECENTYIDKTFQNWDGYIIRVEDYRQTLYQYLHHAVSILVKMDNSETDAHADVLLTFDSEMVDIFDETLNNIDRGNQIGFNATMKSIGNHQQTRHMHVINIWKKEGFLNIPAHIHDGGRYDDTPRRMRGKADELPPTIQQAETNEQQNDEEIKKIQINMENEKNQQEQDEENKEEIIDVNNESEN